ncbi:AAA family ATPase [Mycobacterium sp. Y57]|uniref:AAA family ATPase n=1 Tax=Mycolicibacterium xanthum TaxID=2796469 RepID=UPI001C842D55|nr:AAA family ATPase [Mycolicibacterium xanthum]MBX7433609.1 AAA family ATPase [Mycolicibacterium xanthum]
MKLHRLTLTNYRGITHRDIEFPERGVVIVSGANEIGKSSMLEALDLLLEAKDRSTKKEVKQVKPTHADVGAEITAEISSGPYRFVYRKRFHKRPETDLTVLAPRREQLTGDEAHDRVRAMLAETVDMDLWKAQRVLQSDAIEAAELSGCDALSRALDVAAGSVDDAPTAGAGNADALLIDRIEQEYRQYFTPTGRATGEWAAARTRLTEAEQKVARCAAAIAEVDEAVRRHAALSAELSELASECASAAEQLTVAGAAADAVAALRGEHERATAIADAATVKHAASQSALTERRRSRADIDERSAVVTLLEQAAEQAAEDLATGTEVQAAAEAAARQARAAVEASQARVDAARSAVQRLADREEAERLAARLDTIERHRRDLDAVRRDLAAITITDPQMAEIDSAAAYVDRASAAVAQACARVELLAEVDLEVTLAGETVTLRAGETRSAAVTGTAGVEVAGVLSMSVTPGASATTTQAELDAANVALARALSAAGVGDAAQARELDSRRRDRTADRDRIRAILDALTADDSADALRARLTTLRANDVAEDAGPAPEQGGLWDPVDGPPDPAALRAELDAATAAHQQAGRECDTRRRVAEEAAKVLSQRGLCAARAKEKLAAAQTELATAGQRLAAQRGAQSDDQLTLAAEADAEAARAAQATVARLGQELAGHEPDAVGAALAAAERHSAGLAARRDDAGDALREVATQLKVYGTEGRKGALDDAETHLQRTEADYQRVRRRARAAELLRSVMGRHRDAMRLRYVDPFRREVERLGRIVFGQSFEVDVDSELRIGHRTLAGRTVPYESLSGGAKEQLGIVARLAAAALVAKEDSVPVVIDDALGFTDPDRLSRMAEVFDTVAGDGQVIILTCSPHRYADIHAARRIELVG